MDTKYELAQKFSEEENFPTASARIQTHNHLLMSPVL